VKKEGLFLQKKAIIIPVIDVKYFYRPLTKLDLLGKMNYF